MISASVLSHIAMSFSNGLEFFKNTFRHLVGEKITTEAFAAVVFTFSLSCERVFFDGESGERITDGVGVESVAQ